MPVRVEWVVDWAIKWSNVGAGWAVVPAWVVRVLIGTAAFIIRDVVVIEDVWVSMVSTLWRALITIPRVSHVHWVMVTATIRNGIVEVY